MYLSDVLAEIIKHIPTEMVELKQSFQSLKQSVDHAANDNIVVWWHVVAARVEQLLPKGKSCALWQANVVAAFNNETVQSLKDKYKIEIVD